jgi:hypothetical protein
VVSFEWSVSVVVSLSGQSVTVVVGMTELGYPQSPSTHHQTTQTFPFGAIECGGPKPKQAVSAWSSICPIFGYIPPPFAGVPALPYSEFTLRICSDLRLNVGRPRDDESI